MSCQSLNSVPSYCAKCAKCPFVYLLTLDMKHSLGRMGTLIECFQFTADMGSLEFSNQETEYKLRRGMSACTLCWLAKDLVNRLSCNNIYSQFPKLTCAKSYTQHGVKREGRVENTTTCNYSVSPVSTI